jgi:hypothetical protein
MIRMRLQNVIGVLAHPRRHYFDAIPIRRRTRQAEVARYGHLVTITRHPLDYLRGLHAIPRRGKRRIAIPQDTLSRHSRHAWCVLRCLSALRAIRH